MTLRLAVLALLICTSAAPAATPNEIDRAIKNGVAALRQKYIRGQAAAQPGAIGVGAAGGGIGVTCLTGLALLEAGTPVNDEAVKTITRMIRDAAPMQTRTYEIALCLMYFDRLRDPADVPMLQALAVRLLAGQTNSGGWSYECITAVSGEDQKRLREMKPEKSGVFHSGVKQYAQALATGGRATGMASDDNSNTQFGLLAVWMARKHGVPVDGALNLVEKRFVMTQIERTGNWSYSGGLAGGAAMSGSPAMYCAGLLGMATGLARREDRKKTEMKNVETPRPKKTTPPKSNDPFYNPPIPKEPEKKPAKARPATVQDLVIQRAFAGLGLTFAELARKGGLLSIGVAHGYGDLYFIWSMERVGVAYGIEKLGGLDWYDVVSTLIVRSQLPDGSWGNASYGSEVNTAFAVLVLSRSNLARDLSSKLQRDATSTEMRAGNGPTASELLPHRPAVGTLTPPPVLELPNPTGDKGITLASQLLKSSDGDWKKLLAQARDAKGSTNTRALMLTAANTAGSRKLQARAALAERFCRMTPATLRSMMKAEHSELRRAAALACAMKDDKQHIPDLIELITDPDVSVMLAAKAGLRSLTGQNFGPAPTASPGQKALAATAWKEWYAKEKR